VGIRKIFWKVSFKEEEERKGRVRETATIAALKASSEQ
jgi:hypothetical protein